VVAEATIPSLTMVKTAAETPATRSGWTEGPAMKMRAAMLSGHKTCKGKGKLRQWQESHLSHLSLSSLFLACRFRQSSADNVL
jgi:hypothetical protein